MTIKVKTHNQNAHVENYPDTSNKQKPVKKRRAYRTNSYWLKHDYLRLSKLYEGVVDPDLLAPEIEEIIIRNPLAYECYFGIAPEIMLELNYDIRKTQMALDFFKEFDLKILLYQAFKPNQSYSNTFIRMILQMFYKDLNLKNRKGEIKKANPLDLGKNNRFTIRPCRTKSLFSEGEENGLFIISCCRELEETWDTYQST